MCAVPWLFLTLGPGWPLLCHVAGGEVAAAIIAVLAAAAGWLLSQAQKRTSQLRRP
jgi:hypothetical protein